MSAGDEKIRRQQEARRKKAEAEAKKKRMASYNVVKKTSIGKKRMAKAKTYEAGSNVLDRVKRGTYDDALKAGTRADDPRNWEYHYKAPSDPDRKEGRFINQTKGSEGYQLTRGQRARRKAETAARNTGKEIYQVKKIEYDTETVKGETRQATANAKAIRPRGAFGSTKVAQGVAASKALANRRVKGRGKSRPNAFEAQPKSQRGIA